MKLPAIFPTVTADNPHVFREQIERAVDISGRAHIDISDGDFSPEQLLGAERIWLPDRAVADVHLMVQRPLETLSTVIALQPRCIVVHAESVQADAALEFVSSHGIVSSVGLLADTTPESAKDLIQSADEVMIFGGHLGYMGGSLDETQIGKAIKSKEINPKIRISWDGGIKPDNIADLAHVGVEIFYVGSAIHRAANPQMAFTQLDRIVNPS